MAKRERKAAAPKKKPATDHPPYRMYIKAGQMLPAFPEEYDRLKTWRDGTRVLVHFSSEGDRPQIREWWATLGDYLKADLEEISARWSNKDAMSIAMKWALGMVTSAMSVNDQLVGSTMHLYDYNDEELERFLLTLKQLLFNLTKVDPEELRRNRKLDRAHDEESWRPDWPPYDQQPSDPAPHPPAGSDSGAGGTPTRDAVGDLSPNPSVVPNASNGIEDTGGSAGSGATQAQNPSAAAGPHSTVADVAGVSGASVDTPEVDKLAADPSEPAPAVEPGIPQQAAGDGKEIPTATGAGAGGGAEGGPQTPAGSIGAVEGGSAPQSVAPPSQFTQAELDFMKVAARLMAASTGFQARTVLDASVKSIVEWAVGAGIPRDPKNPSPLWQRLIGIRQMCIDVCHGVTPELDLSMVAELAVCKTVDLIPASYGMTREQLLELKRYEDVLRQIEEAAKAAKQFKAEALQ